MKALFTLKSAINQSTMVAFAALVSLSAVIYPELALGASLQTQGQDQLTVFEIKDPSVITNKNLQTTTNSLTYDQIVASDPYAVRLKAYLEKHNSPLAEYADQMVTLPDWQKALAISWVESNFGIHCADNNCSGIGVAPGHPSWRRYPNKLEWFKDMTALLQKPIYKEKYTTFRQMKGIYVYPGSEAWVNGAQKKYNELMALTADAENEKLATAHSHTVYAATTKVELATLQ